MTNDRERTSEKFMNETTDLFARQSDYTFLSAFAFLLLLLFFFFLLFYCKCASLCFLSLLLFFFYVVFVLFFFSKYCLSFNEYEFALF